VGGIRAASFISAAHFAKRNTKFGGGESEGDRKKSFLLRNQFSRACLPADTGTSRFPPARFARFAGVVAFVGFVDDKIPTRQPSAT